MKNPAGKSVNKLKSHLLHGVHPSSAKRNKQLSLFPNKDGGLGKTVFFQMNNLRNMWV